MILRRIAAALMMALAAGPVAANWCAVPGRDGNATPTGIVNTYYPVTADEAVGSTSINIGAARGAAATVAAGDLFLIIQMQDATINSGNSDSYGDGVNEAGTSIDNPGRGYTGIAQTGRYEFVRATGPIAGGALPVVSATGGGLVHAYDTQAAAGTTQRNTVQIIRVPQYNNATIGGTVTAAAWNGATGGVVVLDVAGRLTFSGGTVNVAGLGFRGGAGRRHNSGGSGLNTDYRTTSSGTDTGNNASKAEGIAGTPRYTNDSGTYTDNTHEGYPNGSYARGAPGNAGGGGTDGSPTDNQQNSGGGGGGNGGLGGRGGHSWCDTPAGYNGCSRSGGWGGAAVAELGVSRLTMGGGGGAGTNNNGTGGGAPIGFASSGGGGGGIVIIRAGEFAGTGTINADGADVTALPTNDGSGGGGAGGSVLLSSVRTVAGTAISVSAQGGDGGSNTGGGAPHGPGGGGGGGYVASSFAIAANVNGGAAGTTAAGSSTYGINYGATAGAGGPGIVAITGANIPGASSGGECTPTIAKSFTASPITTGAPSRLDIAVTNNNPTLLLSAMAFTDNYPAGLVNTATPLPGKSCANPATFNAVAGGSLFGVSAATINAASTCTYSVNVTATSAGDKTNTLAAGALTGSYSSGAVATLADASATIQVSPPLTIVKSSQVYIDPLNGTTNPKYIPGSFVAYTVTITNPGSVTVDNNTIVITDPTPSNLRLFVGNVPGGTGPALFQDGSPASGLTYTFTSLSSTTDDIDFSSDGGSTWTYVPTPNATSTDPNVTHIRIQPKGSMAPGSSFNLIFGYEVL